MAVAFAAKLRLAAAALGCNSRKEFCARFRGVNPATQCDIDRLNKWVQGRSLPRASSVYADFAAVIGSSNSGRWVADCSLQEFAAEVMARTGVDAATLATPDSLSRRGNPRAAGLFGGMATLTGPSRPTRRRGRHNFTAVCFEAHCALLRLGAGP